MKNKKLLLSMIPMLLLLSGCGVNGPDSIVGPDNVSGFWNYIVYFFSQAMIFFGNLFGNNIIVGLIIVTLLFRLAMVPLFKKQINSTAAMTKVQPEMKVIQDKYKNLKDNESKMKMNQEMQALYKRHGVNPMAGCLPLLIQLPLMFVFYDAIQNLLIWDGLSLYPNAVDMSTSFLFWGDLGEPVFAIAAFAAVTTYFSTYVATLGQPKQEGVGGAMMTQMKYVMPAMILLMGMTLPGALAVYWSVGNIVQILQTLILKRDTISAARSKNKIMK